MLERIEVFKAGKHRAMDGAEYDFSEADVAAIAAAYDPAVLMSPIVLGHPKTDHPAWGWAKGYSAEAGVLFAETQQVNADFAAGVEGGSYKYVSLSLYAPTDSRNPKPGTWYPRHIGYLGAQPPAVKGLTPAFSEAPEDGLVAFSTVDAGLLRDLFRRFRDWMIEDKGLEVADQVLPSWFIDNIEVTEGARFAEAGDETIAAPADATLPAGEASDVLFAERISELDTREAGIRAREVAFAEGERAKAREADDAYLDGLVAAGRLPPGFRANAAAVFAHLDGDTTVAFSEPDTTARAELRKLFDGLGVSIQFAEVSASDGFTGEHDAGVLAAKASQLVADAHGRGVTLSYADAVRQARAS